MVEMKANSGVLLMKHSKIHSCICQLEHQLLLKDFFWMSHKLPSSSIRKTKKIQKEINDKKRATPPPKKKKSEKTTKNTQLP